MPPFMHGELPQGLAGYGAGGAGLHPTAQPRHLGSPSRKHSIAVHVTGPLAMWRSQVLQPSKYVMQPSGGVLASGAGSGALKKSQFAPLKLGAHMQS